MKTLPRIDNRATDYGLAVKRFKSEVEYGQATGNYCLTTSAGLRLTVATFDPLKIREYLLTEMGIGESVESRGDCIQIEFRNHHSFATVIRALQGAFNVAMVMGKDGRQIIRIAGLKPSSCKICIT